MASFAEWRAERAQRRRAAAVAKVAMAEPDEDDVRWLAERAAGGDADHARWEWRYARRAFAIVVAQRDALDDRTGSLVAAAIARAMARDPMADAAKRAVTTDWLPALEEFRPQMLFISAGFDAHREDLLGGMALEEADYVWITRELMAVAEKHAEKRIVSMLEGGYNLNALGRSALAHVKTLTS